MTDAAVNWALGDLRAMLGEVFSPERVADVMRRYTSDPDAPLCAHRVQKTVLHAFAVALWPLKGQGDVRIFTALVERCTEFLRHLPEHKLESIVWDGLAGPNGLRHLIPFARWLVDSLWGELLTHTEFPGLDWLPPLRLAQPLASSAAGWSMASGGLPTQAPSAEEAPLLPGLAEAHLVPQLTRPAPSQGCVSPAGGCGPVREMTLGEAWRLVIPLLRQAYEAQIRAAGGGAPSPRSSLG